MSEQHREREDFGRARLPEFLEREGFSLAHQPKSLEREGFSRACQPEFARLTPCTAVLVVAIAAGVVSTGVGCRKSRPEPAAAAASPSTAAPAPQSPPMAHGDHNPHHGGVVLMKGDLHYEALFDPTGKSHQLFFSDAVREDLPASFASSVSFIVKRPGQPDEVVPMQIDAAGESWIGSGRSIANPAATTVRVAFTVAGEPYWVDVPMNAESAQHQP